MPPWERYQQQQAPPPPTAGPWQRYQQAQPEGVVTHQQTHRNVQPGAVLPIPGATAPETEGWGDYLLRKAGAAADPILTPLTGAKAVYDATVAAGPAAADFAREQAGITGTHYRNLGRVAGLPVEPPTPEAQSRYRDEVISGVLSAAGGMLGKAFGGKIGDALKYLGRGGRSVPGAGRFLAQNAEHVTAHGASRGSLLGPPLSGLAVQQVLDATDVGGIQSHELAGDTAATTAGVGVAGLVAKNTVDDLLLGNQRWREVMMRPSSGTASGVLGAVLGYLASRGLMASKDTINDAADYVAGLFGGDDEPEQPPR